MKSQDDWEIGRSKTLRPQATGCFPELMNSEKIEHKVVCAVISGQMRHGIRIGQRERSSIYDIEELYGQSEEVCLGGSPTEVEFELQLKVQAPSTAGPVFRVSKRICFEETGKSMVFIWFSSVFIDMSWIFLELPRRLPGPCGICRCSLELLQPESPQLEQSNDALMEVSFDASAEEHLHFYISSSYFDSNSIYTARAPEFRACDGLRWP